VLLWLFWVIHAMASFWLILVVMALPLAISVTRRAVENVLRPPGSMQVDGRAPSVLAACIDRGIRALLILGAVAVLAWGWGIDLAHFHDQETWIGRLADGVLSAVVILLVADVLWHAIKAAIDRKLADAAAPACRTPTKRESGPGCAPCCQFSGIFCSPSSLPSPC
jgi:hypothetical protein